MKSLLLISIFLLTCAPTKVKESERPSTQLKQTGGSQDLTLIARVPDMYFGDESSDYASLAAIQIEDGVITNLEKINESDIGNYSGAMIFKSGDYYDYVFPGFINLHNHTNYNHLPVWDIAKGQFENRFEWRTAFGDYKKAVSDNNNPWISDKIAKCSAFRYSEVQAMAHGTVYLQGPHSCTDDFAILKVEDKDSYLTSNNSAELEAVNAPTDLIIPGDFTYLWDELKPLIDNGDTYEKALFKKIKAQCPQLIEEKNLQDVDSDYALDILSERDNLDDLCNEAGMHNKFVRYIYWVHKGIIAKKNYLKQANRSGYIVHLGEGRRNDKYNQIEFEMVKLLGLDMPGISFVHGLGIKPQYYSEMAQKDMGIIWSPFSNFLLYAETLDIKAVLQAGIKVALGTDWTPTGTKSVLHELKIAKRYVERENLGDVVTDKELLKMVTEYPAKMISHYESSPSDGRYGIGTIKEGAAASLVVVNSKTANPYESLLSSDAEDINLVLVNGKRMYGSPQYMDGIDTEDFPYYPSNSVISTISPPPSQPDSDASNAEEDAYDDAIEAYYQSLYRWAADVASNNGISSSCNFSKKIAVMDSGLSYRDDIYNDFGYDLDSPTHIASLLNIMTLTQSYNAAPQNGRGDPDYKVNVFPSMFMCQDDYYRNRLENYIRPGSSSDELTDIEQNHSQYRSQFGLGSFIENLEEKYNL